MVKNLSVSISCFLIEFGTNFTLLLILAAARISRSVKFVPNSIKKQLIETDKFLTTEIYNFENFGLIKINTQTQEIEISLNDVDGNELFSDKI